MEPENFGTEKKKNSYYCYLDESRTVPRTTSVKQDAGSGKKCGHQLRVSSRTCKRRSQCGKDNMNIC